MPSYPQALAQVSSQGLLAVPLRLPGAPAT